MAVVEWKNIGKSPALRFRITRWVDFGLGSDKNYKESRPFPGNIGPGTSLPDEAADTVAVSRTVFSDVQSISVNLADTKAWDGTYPTAVFGNVYFRDTAGRDYCNPYLFLLIKSGATLVASEDVDAKCKDPDML